MVSLASHGLASHLSCSGWPRQPNSRPVEFDVVGMMVPAVVLVSVAISAECPHWLADPVPTPEFRRDAPA